MFEFDPWFDIPGKAPCGHDAFMRNQGALWLCARCFKKAWGIPSQSIFDVWSDYFDIIGDAMDPADVEKAATILRTSNFVGNSRVTVQGGRVHINGGWLMIGERPPGNTLADKKGERGYVYIYLADIRRPAPKGCAVGRVGGGRMTDEDKICPIAAQVASDLCVSSMKGGPRISASGRTVNEMEAFHAASETIAKKSVEIAKAIVKEVYGK